VSDHQKDRFSLTSAGLIAGVFVGNMVSATPVINGTFGIFLQPLSESLGWSRSAVTGLLFVLAIAGVVGYPFFGRLADRWSIRKLLIGGNFLFGGSVAALSLSNASMPTTYGLYLLAGIAGCIPSAVVTAKIVDDWFSKHRGLAFGIAIGGGLSLGFVVLPLVAQWLVGSFGWRGAFIGLGAGIILAGQTMFWFLVKPRTRMPADIQGLATTENEGLTASEVRRSPLFWTLLLIAVLMSSGLLAVMVHLVAMAGDRGISAGIAVIALSAGALANALWQIVMGRLLDRFATPAVTAPGMLASLAGLYLLVTGETATAFAIGGLLLGVGAGTENGMVPVTLRRYFGARAYGENYGMVYGISLLASGAGPFFMAMTFDATGNYTVGLTCVALMVILSAILALKLPAYGAWKAG
jgi:MFS family permease